RRKKELSSNPEYMLLKALQKDFANNHGLIMVDTFEKNKINPIKSKIDFQDDEFYKRIDIKEVRFKDYIANLATLLVKDSTFIIAGRNMKNELDMKVSEEYTEEIKLDKFNSKNLKDFFDAFGKKNSFPTPTKEQLSIIEELTLGNPLLVHLLSQVAKQYDNWGEFDYVTMKRHINEDEEHGLLFYLTDRILSHANIKDIYKLVIPRVLTKKIATLLFGKPDVLREIVDSGLGFKGLKDNFNCYYLHDSVYSAILNYAEQNIKEHGLSSWHDNPKVKELHQKLIEFYSKGDAIHGVNSEFEICYHTMMLRDGFEDEFEVSREEFSNFILGSLGLPLQNKKDVCKNFNALEKEHIEVILNVLRNERDILAIINPKLYRETSKALALGIIEDFMDMDFLKG
ncbi:MAG: hypothetical protein KAU90_04465, partial [Sulfurovaceae bacterium]|nr:hypothetical protein [Sulfurovaceae bacterium]